MEKTRIGSFSQFIFDQREDELILKNKIRLRKFINECCQDYEETDYPGKMEILKDILLLLMKMVFGENEVHIELGQRYKKG